MVQSFLNMTKLTCRGPGRKTPLQLLMGVSPNYLSLVEELCGISSRNVERLREVSEELSRKIHRYQEEAYHQDLAYRAMANRRLNQKLVPIYFHNGEYVLVSEKGVDSGNKDKCRPRWSGPFQVVQVISEHLYEVEDLTGKRRIRHSSLMIPFTPSSFLPDADTKAVFILDKGKLEVEKIYAIRKTVEGEIQLKLKWKGFPSSQSTWESAVLMFEDIPSLVVNYLENEGSLLSTECLQFLKTLYPDSSYWNNINISKITVEDPVYGSLDKKLVEGHIFINTRGEWFQVNWSMFEYYMLRIAVLKYGMGDFAGIAIYLPGKGKQQVYIKLQRVLYRQSLEHYHGLRIDIEQVRKDNYKLLNGGYFKLKMPRTKRLKVLERVLCLWRCGKRHVANSKKFQALTPVYNPLTLEGLKMMLGAVKEKIVKG
eukprot:snap_masked-scaffold_16-processed-gene-0.8-mRNA-1 protein AED:1.00 eAED:1.00 QI:0/-1/0/0/-1/1/1/0/425